MKNDPATRKQPAPEGDGRVVGDMVIQDIGYRMQMGLQAYGTYLKTSNGRDALVDLYQELLDAVLYLRQLLAEREGE